MVGVFLFPRSLDDYVYRLYFPLTNVVMTDSLLILVRPRLANVVVCVLALAKRNCVGRSSCVFLPFHHIISQAN